MGCTLGEFGYSRAMLTKQNSVYPILSTICAAVLCGCPTSEPGDPGATEPSPTTATGVPVETTDETFAPPTSSTTEVEPEPTETSSSTGGGETTTSTTANLDPLWCDEILTDEVCRVRRDTFCGEMELDADLLPDPYRQIAIDKCESDPCGACFYLANTCVQLLGEKGCGPDLYERCVCLADLHGVI